MALDTTRTTMYQPPFMEPHPLRNNHSSVAVRDSTGAVWDCTGAVWDCTGAVHIMGLHWDSMRLHKVQLETRIRYHPKIVS